MNNMQAVLRNSTQSTSRQEDTIDSFSDIFEPRSSRNDSQKTHSTIVKYIQEGSPIDDDIEKQKQPSEENAEVINTLEIKAPVNDRITDRIANNYALLLMQKPPEADKRFENPTAIIAPEGAYQWNEEIAQWTCRLSAENFNADYQDLNFLLQRATKITNAEGESAYTLLTLKQLNMLDQAIRIYHGDTIIGYTICEEIYLRQINFIAWIFRQKYFQFDYPPLPEAYSKRLLTFIHRPLVLDITASLRVAAQSYLLFQYFTEIYFQYVLKNNNLGEFIDNNTVWILSAFFSSIALSLFFCVVVFLISSVFYQR